MHICKSASQLWEGCVQGSVAHAIFTARAPDFSFTHSWSENNYSVNNASGCRGTISFQITNGISFVGAFFDENSNKNPFKNGGFICTDELFSNLPRSLAKLGRNETLEFLLQVWEGKTVPIITSLFWGNETKTECFGGHEDFLQNGGRIVCKEMFPPSDSLELWCEEFELSDVELHHVKNLFSRRMTTNKDAEVYLTPEELKFLEEISVGDEGFSLCLESLEELRIVPE